jgi:hypothetical protein
MRNLEAVKNAQKPFMGLPGFRNVGMLISAELDAEGDDEEEWEKRTETGMDKVDSVHSVQYTYTVVLSVNRNSYLIMSYQVEILHFPSFPRKRDSGHFRRLPGH